MGETQTEVEKQRRQNQQANGVQPVDTPVENVQLSGVGKSKHPERGQADGVEVQGPLGLPPPQKNEDTDEKIEEADRFKKPLQAQIGRLGTDHQGSGVCGPGALQGVLHLRPHSQLVQFLRHLGGPGDRPVVDGHQHVALANAGPVGGPSVFHDEGFHAASGPDPPAPVIRRDVLPLLPDILDSDHRQQRGDENDQSRLEAEVGNHCLAPGQLRGRPART